MKKPCEFSQGFFNSQFSILNYGTTFHDFCRDSAKQASLMALTAPKILNSQLFAGIGAPKHLFAEGAEEVASAGFDDAYLEGGAAYFYCGVLTAAETVAVN